MNSYTPFRSYVREHILTNGTPSGQFNSEVSRMWKTIPQKDKRTWKRLAKQRRTAAEEGWGRGLWEFNGKSKSKKGTSTEQPENEAEFMRRDELSKKVVEKMQSWYSIGGEGREVVPK